MPRKVDTVARFFRRVVSFSTEWKDYEPVLTPDFSQKEFPSPQHPKGVTLNAAELLKRVGEQRKQLSAQHFEMTTQIETDNQVAVEILWTGLLAADLGPFKKGKNIKANLCMVFDFQGDKILAQRIYDSHEPVSG
ncbi:MAG TPA: nuclear transport factor 2 family protein [Planctomycetota bacterium]|nr:nuclear transport factor 2 family protein [Planctomycetota bacterium]